MDGGIRAVEAVVAEGRRNRLWADGLQNRPGRRICRGRRDLRILLCQALRALLRVVA